MLFIPKTCVFNALITEEAVIALFRGFQSYPYKICLNISSHYPVGWVGLHTSHLRKDVREDWASFLGLCFFLWLSGFGGFGKSVSRPSEAVSCPGRLR